jgi:hypothetical protein
MVPGFYKLEGRQLCIGNVIFQRDMELADIAPPSP